MNLKKEGEEKKKKKKKEKKKKKKKERNGERREREGLGLGVGADMLSVMCSFSDVLLYFITRFFRACFNFRKNCCHIRESNRSTVCCRR